MSGVPKFGLAPRSAPKASFVVQKPWKSPREGLEGLRCLWLLDGSNSTQGEPLGRQSVLACGDPPRVHLR